MGPISLLAFLWSLSSQQLDTQLPDKQFTWQELQAMEKSERVEEAFIYHIESGDWRQALSLAQQKPQLKKTLLKSLSNGEIRRIHSAYFILAELDLEKTPQEALKWYRLSAKAHGQFFNQRVLLGLLPPLASEYPEFRDGSYETLDVGKKYRGADGKMLRSISEDWYGPGSHRDNGLIRRFIQLEDVQSAQAEFGRIHKAHQASRHYSSNALRFSLDYALFLQSHKQPDLAIQVLTETFPKVFPRLSIGVTTQYAGQRKGGISPEKFLEVATGLLEKNNYLAQAVETLLTDVDTPGSHAEWIVSKLLEKTDQADKALQHELHYIATNAYFKPAAKAYYSAQACQRHKKDPTIWLEKASAANPSDQLLASILQDMLAHKSSTGDNKNSFELKLAQLKLNLGNEDLFKKLSLDAASLGKTEYFESWCSKLLKDSNVPARHRLPLAINLKDRKATSAIVKEILMEPEPREELSYYPNQIDSVANLDYVDRHDILQLIAKYAKGGQQLRALIELTEYFRQLPSTSPKALTAIYKSIVDEHKGLFNHSGSYSHPVYGELSYNRKVYELMQLYVARKKITQLKKGRTSSSKTNHPDYQL